MRRVEGFSLAELIMVIVILGILSAFIGPMLFNAMRSYDQIQASVATQAKMRYAMERMARELRDIRRQATDATFLDISSMSAASMEFFKTDGTRVVIERVGNAINLAYSSLAGMLTDQVGAFTLAYFETDATPVDDSTLPAMAASLSFVEISLTLTEGANSFPARLRVDLRNPR